MTRFVRLSLRLYTRALLPLYQPELLRDFGPDILQAFSDDLSDATELQGIPGALRVWRRAVSELIPLALPACAENPFVAVPCIMFAATEILMTAELSLAALTHPNQPLPLALIPFFCLAPSALAALTAFVAVYAGNRSLPSRIRLN